ncbi:heavy-metal-associated domain-containing protein [Hymenobacter weizhouensis]|uniref:heavy-metal-associated domain-containing protein n=1 Tax=Hymenobacter sp. YIM 151500-1 TaxID=2987689 RepID=UPI002226C30C|nr:heavy-metal-associated domain-containing protein [Hymenobacter sp. YIM 151500-1]UYZ62130.1 heavy-metal-associated domain-containing protein [Hymenobacter sp. YIM 151500-1]
MLRVEGVGALVQARRLQEQVAAVPGVAACTINPRTSLATVSYDEAVLPKQELLRVLSVGGLFRVEEVPGLPAAD